MLNNILDNKKTISLSDKIYFCFSMWIEGKISTLQFCEALLIDKYYTEKPSKN